MQRTLSTYLFVNRKLTPALVADVAHAGFHALELFCARTHFDYRAPQDVHELGVALAENSVALHAVHSPTDRDRGPGREGGLPISICEPERVRRLDAVDEIKRALDLAERIPFSILVQHLASAREPMDQRRRDAAFTSLEHLMVFAKQRGVTIALENTPGEMATPANLREFLETTRLHDLRLCFDIGHAHMDAGVEPSFTTMRELVVTTHIHDNRGDKDDHLFPYEGTIDWDAALRALLSGPLLGSRLPLVLEIKDPVSHVAALEQPSSAVAPLHAARGVFEKFEQALVANASNAPGAHSATD